MAKFEQNKSFANKSRVGKNAKGSKSRNHNQTNHNQTNHNQNGGTRTSQNNAGIRWGKNRRDVKRAEAKLANTATKSTRNKISEKALLQDYIFGINPVYEALLSNVPIVELFVVTSSVHQSERISEIIKIANQKNITIHQVERSKFESLLGGNASLVTHQNVLVKIKPFNYCLISEVFKKLNSSSTNNKESVKPALFLLLDGVTDPHNLGAIVRSAAAFGVDSIILPKNRSAQITPTTYKTSAGTVPKIDICQTTNLHYLIKDLKTRGFWIVGLSGQTTDLIGELSKKLDFHSDNIALVAGSEGTGISSIVARSCDFLVRIPMASEVESLNVSVATALALYELRTRTSG